MIHYTGPGGSLADTHEALVDHEVALALAGVTEDGDVEECLAEIYGASAAASYMANLGSRQFDEELDRYV